MTYLFWGDISTKHLLYTSALLHIKLYTLFFSSSSILKYTSEQTSKNHVLMFLLLMRGSRIFSTISIVTATSAMGWDEGRTLSAHKWIMAGNYLWRAKGVTVKYCQCIMREYSCQVRLDPLRWVNGSNDLYAELYSNVFFLQGEGFIRQTIVTLAVARTIEKNVNNSSDKLAPVITNYTQIPSLLATVFETITEIFKSQSSLQKRPSSPFVNWASLTCEWWMRLGLACGHAMS